MQGFMPLKCPFQKSQKPFPDDIREWKFCSTMGVWLKFREKCFVQREHIFPIYEIKMLLSSLFFSFFFLG